MLETWLISPQGERIALRGQQVLVGREPQCAVVLDDPSVSREHALLTLSDTSVTVKDNNSRNGTFVEGQRLAAGETRSVATGQTVGFGNCVMRLQRELRAANDRTFEVRDLLPEQRRTQSSSEALPTLLADVMYRAQGALFPAQPIESLHEALLHLCLAFVPGSFAALEITEGEVRRGLLRDGTPVVRDIALSSALRSAVLRDKKTVLMRDRESDDTLKGSASLMAAGVTSAVAAPIFDGDEIMGLLYVTIQDGSQALSEVDAAVCTVLASVAGTALLAAGMMRDLLVQNEGLRDQLRALGVEPKQ